MNQLEWIDEYLQQAEQLIYENQVDQGIAILQNLLYEEPGYSSLHNHLGWVYMYYKQDLTKAELHFRMAIKFDETFAPPYLHMGTLCNRSHRFSEAIEFFQCGLSRVNANRMALLEGIALAYEFKKEYSKAIRYYKEAMTSAIGAEMSIFVENIRRCRKKRLVMMFTF